MARRQDKDSLNAQQINNVLFTGTDEANYEGSDIEDAPTEDELSSDFSDEDISGQVIPSRLPQPTPRLVPCSVNQVQVVYLVIRLIQAVSNTRSSINQV